MLHEATLANKRLQLPGSPCSIGAERLPSVRPARPQLKRTSLCGHAKKRQEGGSPARILSPNSIPAPFRSLAARRRPPGRSRQPSSPPAQAPRPGAPCATPRQHWPPGGWTFPLACPSRHRAPLGRGARPRPVGALGSSTLGPPRSRASSTAGRPEFRALVPCPEPGGGPAGPGADRFPPLAVAAFWMQVSRAGRAPSGILVGAAPAPGCPITRIWS
jgi:hypothetical protein